MNNGLWGDLRWNTCWTKIPVHNWCVKYELCNVSNKCTEQGMTKSYIQWNYTRKENKCTFMTFTFAPTICNSLRSVMCRFTRVHPPSYPTVYLLFFFSWIIKISSWVCSSLNRIPMLNRSTSHITLVHIAWTVTSLSQLYVNLHARK